MNSFEILKQEIQSWYPDYEFTDDELNVATNNLIEFFAKGALAQYEAKNENNSLQTPENKVELKQKQGDNYESDKFDG